MALQTVNGRLLFTGGGLHYDTPCCCGSGSGGSGGTGNDCTTYTCAWFQNGVDVDSEGNLIPVWLSTRSCPDGCTCTGSPQLTFPDTGTLPANVVYGCAYAFSALPEYNNQQIWNHNDNPLP